MMCKVKDYVKASYPALWIETHEETRAVNQISSEISTACPGYQFYVWDRIDGIKKIEVKKSGITTARVGGDDDLGDPLIALDWANTKMPENSVLYLLDWHHYAKKDVISRKVRNLLPTNKCVGKVLAFVSPKMEIPDELEKEVTPVRFELPGVEELRKILRHVVNSCQENGMKLDMPKNDLPILTAALGMTSIEAENAFVISIVEKKEFDQDVIRREKSVVVKKTGLLEVMETGNTLDDVGGLENLKTWLTARAGCFGEEAKAFGLTSPKGALLIGVPGTGKSLTAKAVAHVWHRPLLRLDMGKVFGSYVGESESKIRQVLAVYEAVAPCVLFIDEMEKAFAGTGGGELDGGTTKRVFGTFLTWMNDRKADVFIVATANNVQALPPELLRPGRFDASFWVDLPGPKQREEILAIHLKKVKRDPKNFDLKALAGITDGYSGAEIEVWVQEALTHAYAAKHEFCTEDLAATVGEVTPVSRLMSANIQEARKWASDHGVKMASKAAELPTLNATRKIAV